MTLVLKGTKHHYAIFADKYFVNNNPPYPTPHYRDYTFRLSLVLGGSVSSDSTPSWPERGSVNVDFIDGMSSNER